MHAFVRAAAVVCAFSVATPVLAQSVLMPRQGAAPIISATAKPIPAGLAAADAATMATASRESLFTMRAAYLASSKGQSAATKTLASDLIAYHTQALSDFRGALLASGMKAPAVALTAEQEKRLSDLEAVSGAAFDATFKAAVVASQDRASGALLAHGKSKGNLIIVAQANRQGNQIAQLNTKTKAR